MKQAALSWFSQQQWEDLGPLVLVSVSNSEEFLWERLLELCSAQKVHSSQECGWQNPNHQFVSCKSVSVVLTHSHCTTKNQNVHSGVDESLWYGKEMLPSKIRVAFLLVYWISVQLSNTAYDTCQIKYDTWYMSNLEWDPRISWSCVTKLPKQWLIQSINYRVSIKSLAITAAKFINSTGCFRKTSCCPLLNIKTKKFYYFWGQPAGRLHNCLRKELLRDRDTAFFTKWKCQRYVNTTTLKECSGASASVSKWAWWHLFG